MAKRGAAKQLTQDNYDRSDSEDDNIVGTPTLASEEVLKTRVIKTGRRRLAATNGQADKKNIFGGFQGFWNVDAPAKDTKSTFSFVSSTPAPVSSVPKASADSGSSESVAAPSSANPSIVFGARVTALNNQFLKWAQEQVEKLQGIADLTPCMKSYLTHMERLKKDFEEEKGKDTTTSDSLPAAAAAATFKFGVDASKTEPAASTTSFSGFSFSSTATKPSATTTEATSSSTFSFGTASASSGEFSLGAPSSSAETKTSEPKFSFGAGPVADKPAATVPASTVNPLLGGTSTFTFGLAKPNTTSTFSFGLPSATTGSAPAPGFFSAASAKESQPQAADEGEEGGDDAEEEKQQNFEKKDVKEADAFFETRTKMFYLAGKEFKSRGVGNLFLKNVGEKVQLIVRADNSLGNLLMNVFVKNVNPKLEQNKKSVSMWCIPNPAIDPKSSEQPKPTKFLFNLKDENVAKEFFGHLEKNN